MSRSKWTLADASKNLSPAQQAEVSAQMYPRKGMGIDAARAILAHVDDTPAFRGPHALTYPDPPPVYSGTGDLAPALKSAGKAKRVEPGPSPFLGFCRAAGLPAPTPEHRFDLKRKFRFDYAWIDQKVAVECDGGLWRNYGKAKAGGAHSHPLNILRDIEKGNLATVQGWRIVRCTPDTLLTAATIQLLKSLMQ